MVDTLRIKRRALGGAAGPPATLAVGELAYNEQDSGLYIGRSNGTVVQVNSPSGGGISDAPSDGKTYGRLNATWSQVLPITGGTLTGNLTVSLAGATVILNKPASGSGVTLLGQTNGLARWGVVLGTGSAESTGNVGSDFLVRRYDDTGNAIDVPLTITRSNGQLTLTSATVVQTPTTGTATYVLQPQSGSAVLGLSASASGQVNNIQGSIANKARWIVQLGNGAAESGSGNTGSDFSLFRCNDAGSVIDAPITITRSSGLVTFGSGVVSVNAPASSSAVSYLQKSGSGYANLLLGTSAGVARWAVNIGDATPESGSNAGSNFAIGRYTDAGAPIDSPLIINRQTGAVALNGAPAVWPKMLVGLTLANDATSPNTNINVASGTACSDDDSTMMVLSGAFNKKVNAAWAAGSGAAIGALDTGSIAIGTWYHVFLIERTDTYVVDVLVSLSATAPTMPASYTKKRRIGSIRTDASGNILPFTQLGDEFLWVNAGGGGWNEYNNAGLNNFLTLTPLGYIPPGVKVVAILTILIGGSAGVVQMQSPDTQWTYLSNYNLSTSQPQPMYVRTNTSAQFLLGGQAGTTIFCNSNGWQDARGK